MSENNTRYTIGQEIEVIGFNYGSGKEFWFAPRPFAFNGADYPLSIELFNLKVTEHHQVAWDQDPKGEKQYDGFILTAEDESVWYNQYPVAGYGQTSDNANRRFTINYAKMVPSNEAEEEEFARRCENLGFITVETLTGFISDFYRAVHFAQQEIQSPNQAVRNRAHLIIKFFDDLVKQIFNKHQKKIRIACWEDEKVEIVLGKVELVPATEAGCDLECVPLDKLFK